MRQLIPFSKNIEFKTFGNPWEIILLNIHMGFPGGSDGRPRFHSWVGKIPWSTDVRVLP